MKYIRYLLVVCAPLVVLASCRIATESFKEAILPEKPISKQGTLLEEWYGKDIDTSPEKETIATEPNKNNLAADKSFNFSDSSEDATAYPNLNNVLNQEVATKKDTVETQPTTQKNLPNNTSSYRPW